jgi:hypothetical protein
MQKCKRCGQDLSDDARICPFCGQPVETEDEERRRRLRWHLSALVLERKRSARGFLFSRALLSSQRLPASILVFLTSVFILINIVLAGVLQAYTGSVSPLSSSFTFPLPPSVSPMLLDFGKVEAGSQAILPVIVKTSNQSQLSWRIVSGNAVWLSITLSSETKESNNLREVIYNVTANTSKLQVGPYSETLSVRSDGGKEQRVDVKIQVIPTGPPQPAKLNVNPLMLDFGSQNMGSQKTLPLTVSNSGGSELSWTADKENTSWLTLDVSGGKIAAGGLPQVIKVKDDTTKLKAQRYSARINFTSNDGNAVVDVRLNVVSTPVAGQGPIVSSISPTSGPAAGGTPVTITGTHFTGATSVSFGKADAASFTVDKDDQITATSPAGCGIIDVTVTTPNGTSPTSSADRFTYVPSTPSVTTIDPYSGPATGGTPVTITGSGFMCASGVKFDKTDAASFTVDNDSQITATSPPGSGTVDVTVTTSSGTSAVTYDDQFSYIPVVTGISPRCGLAIEFFTVTITGSGFTGATSVSFGETAGMIVSVSDTQIRASVPTGSGTVHVTVTTPGGTSATGPADLFTYPTLPNVIKISPPSGPQYSVTQIIITGSGFTCATGVKFGETAGTIVSVDSDTKITAESPPLGRRVCVCSLTVDVTVTTPGGISAKSPDDRFTYTPGSTSATQTWGSTAGDPRSPLKASASPELRVSHKVQLTENFAKV